MPDEAAATYDDNGMRQIGVWMPDSVVAIMNAAIATDPDRAKSVGLPFAIAAIIGALPWIAVAVHGQSTPEEYDAFARHLRHEIEGAWNIIAAKDPKAAFARAFEAANRSVQ